MQNSGYIFISYARKNEEFAKKLSTYLNEIGISTWFDRKDIAAATRWEDEIYKGISNCAAFIIVLSENAIESKWVNKELEYAQKQQKTIFPILREKCKNPLTEIQYTDFTADHEWDFSIHRLVSGIWKMRILPNGDNILSTLEKRIDRPYLENQKKLKEGRLSTQAWLSEIRSYLNIPVG
jgi:hypothetical protein